MSDSDKLFICTKIFFDILYVGCRIVEIGIYSTILMNVEKAARSLRIRTRWPDNLQVVSCEGKKVYLKRNIQFGMRDTK